MVRRHLQGDPYNRVVWRDVIIITVLSLFMVGAVFFLLDALFKQDRARQFSVIDASQASERVLLSETSMQWSCTCTVEGSMAACACSRKD